MDFSIQIFQLVAVRCTSDRQHAILNLTSSPLYSGGSKNILPGRTIQSQDTGLADGFISTFCMQHVIKGYNAADLAWSYVIIE